jgi:uncharacterized protein (DUF433 family)
LSTAELTIDRTTMLSREAKVAKAILSLGHPFIFSDPADTLRVAGTRITIEQIYEEVKLGRTAVEIASSYDVLPLTELESVVAFCSRNSSLLEHYCSLRQQSSEEKQREHAQRQIPFSRTQLQARLKTN